MARIRKFNVSEVEGRNPFGSSTAVPLKRGTLALYDYDGSLRIRLHDGVNPEGQPLLDTGNISFNQVGVYGDVTSAHNQGLIEIVPSEAVYGFGQYLKVYATTPPEEYHIHITAGSQEFGTGELFLGDDDTFFSVRTNGTLVAQSKIGNEATSVTLESDRLTVTRSNVSAQVFVEGDVWARDKVSVNSRLHQKVYAYSEQANIAIHSMNDGAIISHFNIAGNISVNLVDVNLAFPYHQELKVVLHQGETPYTITNFYIESNIQDVQWAGNAGPVGTANGIDMYRFDIFNDGETYIVLAQVTSYGG